MSRLQIPSQVNLAKVRSNALQTVVISIVAVVTTSWWIMALLAVDFFIRGVLEPRWSLLSRISARFLIKILPFEQRQIYFPPKQFAARVGLVFSLAAAGLMLFGATTAGIVVAATLTVFASFECFFNVCMGCIIYAAVIAPRKNRGYERGQSQRRAR